MKVLTLPNGKFRVDVIINGRRERKNFTSKDMAEAWLKQSKIQAIHAKLGIDSLTAKQRVIASTVFQRLPPDADLLKIIDAHLSTVQEIEHRNISIAVDDFLNELAKTRKASYVESIGKTLRRFARWSPEPILSLIIKDHIEDFLDSIKQTPVSRYNNIRDLNIFFGWCAEEGWISENPLGHVRRPDVPRAEPKILTVGAAKVLLENTSGQDQAFAVIGMFTGVRPSEIRQMTWDMVNLEKDGHDYWKGFIRLPANITKTSTSRTIQLEPNAAAWLAPLKAKAPPFEADPASQTNRLRMAADIHEWPQGVLRHTFASYHVTAFEQPGRTALYMHSTESPEILFRHYFRDNLKTDALKFWAIYPKK
jgi:integrase